MYEVQKHKQNYIVTADRSFNRKYQLVAKVHAKITGLGVRNRVSTGSSNTAKTFKQKLHSIVANAIGKMAAAYMVDSKEVSVDPIKKSELKFKTIVPASEYDKFKEDNRENLTGAMIIGRKKYKGQMIVVIKYTINKKDVVKARSEKTGRFVKKPSEQWLKSRKLI